MRDFSARIGPLELTAHGRVSATGVPHGAVEPLPVADFIAHDYPRLSRRAADYVAQLKSLDQPRLHLELAPSNTRSAIVTATLFARAVRLEEPFPLQASRLVATVRFPLTGETVVKTRLDAQAGELTLPGGVTARNAHARLWGVLQPELRTFVPDTAEFTASEVSGSGFTATPLAASLALRQSPLSGAVTARLAGSSMNVRGHVDLAAKTATLHLEGKFAPALFRPISEIVGHDLTRWVGFSEAPSLWADVHLATGWKFSALTARLLVPGQYVAYHVPLNDGSGEVNISGHDLRVTDIITSQGENRARGSYTMDMTTLNFRFLLTGQMRPADIGGWFGPWWGHVFDTSTFDFRANVPAADIDVQGQWGQPHLSLEYLGANAPHTGLRGLMFDQVRTRLFIRPGFYDALEFSVTRGSSAAHGAFAVRGDFTPAGFVGLEFDATSTLDLNEAAGMFGEAGPAFIAPFHFAVPPQLHLSGHVDGAAAPGGAHQAIKIEENSGGEFTLFGFPVNNLAFAADLHDDDIMINPVSTNFAGGTVRGQAHLWNHGPDRRLSFDYTLKGANLGQAIGVLQKFSAQRKKTATVPDKVAPVEKSEVNLDLSAAAEGRFDDPFSYHGQGRAELLGPGLGEVRLLGLLSELLNFTTLRFTSLQTDFQINGPLLEMPDLKLTGANSAIAAHGHYDLEHQQLNFNAKLFPFGESKFIPQALIGALLSPLSQILEVKLTGTLDKPSWAFVRGPTNFFRNLAGAPQPVERAVPSAPAATNREIPYYLRKSEPAAAPKKELSPYIRR